MGKNNNGVMMMVRRIRKSSAHVLAVSMVLLLYWLLIPPNALAGEEEDLYLQGSTYSMQGQWDKAINTFNSLITRYPSTRFIDAQFWVGYCQQQNGDYKEAIQTFKSFASRYPQSNYASQALYKIGEIYEKNLHDYDKAMASYREVEKRFPQSHVAVKSVFSNAYLQENALGNFPAAQQSYQRVTELVDGKKDVYQGYKDQSKQRVSFIELHSDCQYKPLKHYNEGMAFEEQGKLDSAIEEYSRILKRFPQSSLIDDTNFRLISCWEKKGNIGKVKELGRYFVSTFPSSEYLPQVRIILKKYGN